MQTAISFIVVYGLLVVNVSILVNGALALAVTFLPAILERDYSIPLHPGLTFWLTSALLLHTAGFLGPYDSVWWWDHVTHTLSATLVAGVGYATTRALDEHSDAVYFPPQFTFVFLLLFTLAAGVLWEVLEFGARLLADVAGVQPVLVQYSLEDTVVDLIFDAVGAMLVAAFGSRELAAVVDALEARLDHV